MKQISSVLLLLLNFNEITKYFAMESSEDMAKKMGIQESVFTATPADNGKHTLKFMTPVNKDKVIYEIKDFNFENFAVLDGMLQDGSGDEFPMSSCKPEHLDRLNQMQSLKDISRAVSDAQTEDEVRDLAALYNCANATDWIRFKFFLYSSSLFDFNTGQLHPVFKYLGNMEDYYIDRFFAKNYFNLFRLWRMDPGTFGEGILKSVQRVELNVPAILSPGFERFFPALLLHKSFKNKLKLKFDVLPWCLIRSLVNNQKHLDALIDVSTFDRVILTQRIIESEVGLVAAVFDSLRRNDLPSLIDRKRYDLEPALQAESFKLSQGQKDSLFDIEPALQAESFKLPQSQKDSPRIVDLELHNLEHTLDIKSFELEKKIKGTKLCRTVIVPKNLYIPEDKKDFRNRLNECEFYEHVAIDEMDANLNEITVFKLAGLTKSFGVDTLKIESTTFLPTLTLLLSMTNFISFPISVDFNSFNQNNFTIFVKTFQDKSHRDLTILSGEPKPQLRIKVVLSDLGAERQYLSKMATWLNNVQRISEDDLIAVSVDIKKCQNLQPADISSLAILLTNHAKRTGLKSELFVQALWNFMSTNSILNSPTIINASLVEKFISFLNQSNF